ncbi:MAG TPA: hypothetical protein DD640_08355 [Clostridiales bacterium]|nr:hypothetical protein [Clostridiales bacterium]
MNTLAARLTFKIIGLLIVDTIVCLLFFTVWTLINLPLLPWALVAVFFTLLILHVAILLSGIIAQKYGTAISVAVVILTLLLNVSVLVLTGTTYLFIRPKYYVLFVLLIYLFYIILMAGFYMAGAKKETDLTEQASEKQASGNLLSLILTTDSNLKLLNGRIAADSYAPVGRAWNSLRERLQASTPFGRVNRTDISNVEQHIFSELEKINRTAQVLNQSESNPSELEYLVGSINQTCDLVKNKEKMIVQ